MIGRYIGPALIGAAALAGPACAQQSDATDGLGSVTSESAFGRDRNTSVLERDRPDYAPEPVRIGVLELTPRMAIGGGYDDNLYATRGAPIADAFVRLRPRLSIVRPSPNLELALNGELDLLRYANRATENATQYDLGGSARYTISNATGANLQLRRARLFEERVSPDSPTGVVRPNRFTLTEATGTVAHVFNRLRISGTLQAENRDYVDNTDPAGLVIDQDFRDRTTVTGTGIVEYALNPSIALFTAGSYNTRDYRQRQGPIPARSSTGYEIAAGASFELGRKTRGSLRAGYIAQDYRDPFFEDIDGLLVRGELAYFLTPLVTITGTLDRSVSETGIAGATGYLATTAGVRADYELLRNLILSAGAELEKRDFANIDRSDDRWTGRANATYFVSRRVTLRADYQLRVQSSDGLLPGREFEKNRISVGLTFAGL